MEGQRGLVPVVAAVVDAADAAGSQEEEVVAGAASAGAGAEEVRRGEAAVAGAASVGATKQCAESGPFPKPLVCSACITSFCMFWGGNFGVLDCFA